MIQRKTERRKRKRAIRENKKHGESCKKSEKERDAE